LQILPRPQREGRYAALDDSKLSGAFEVDLTAICAAEHISLANYILALAIIPRFECSAGR